jgi:hypothetical protein
MTKVRRGKASAGGLAHGEYGREFALFQRLRRESSS